MPGRPLMTKDNSSSDLGQAGKTISLVAEEVSVSKRQITTGRVQVHTVTDYVDEVVQQELQGERLSIERVPIGTYVQPGDPPPEVRTEGGVTIIPLLEEVLVIEKRLLVKEELRISRLATNETTEVPITIRRQRAVIERLDAASEEKD